MSQLDVNNDPSYFNEIKIDDGKWTREQTQILIDTWKKHKDVLLNTASSLSEHFRIWKVIAGEVNKLSPPKSLQQCKKKFRNIRYICKTAMNNNKQPGTKKHYPMFYTEFVKILSESQRLLFGDKVKYELSSDELSEYHHLGEQISIQNEANSETCSIEYESSVNKSYYSNNVVSYNSTHSSSQNSPVSNDEEILNVDGSTSPIVAVIPAMTDGKEPESKLNGIERSQSNEETSQNADDENSRPLRKHRHNDVSIMGRGYPPTKRPRSNASMTPSFQPHDLIHHKSIPSHRINNDFYPTMATIPVEADHLTSVNNHLPPTTFSKITTKHEIHHKDRLTRTVPLKQHIPSEDGKLNNVTTNGITTKANMPPNQNMMEMFQERFLDLQERQMELFNDMLNRHEQFLLRLLQQQKEAAEEAQQRDRNFMFRLVEIFLKQK